MFILSWNVAGWTTTVAGIRSTIGSVAEFFRRTGADVICIQEAKVSRKKVNDSPKECGACDTGNDFELWDSFWSCSENNKSFNGVTTFVRRGLTARADAKPFRNAELDSEGRCVVTYHADVVIFNVYVPNTRDGERFAYKQRFLAALRQTMLRVRQESMLPVILCGDLNMTYRAEDCHFSHRGISLSTAVRYFSEGDMTEKKKQALARLEQFLRTSESVRQEVKILQEKNGDIDEDKDDLCTTSLSLEDFVQIGVESVSCHCLVRGASSSSQNEAIYDLALHAGLPAHDVMETKWLLDEIILQDELVDSFMHVHQGDQTLVNECCPNPFTCWNQYRNSRYQNEGNRIDYILVDKSLSDKLCHDGGSKTCSEKSRDGGGGEHYSLFNGTGFLKGLRRVTEGGKFMPAPTDGGGLMPLSESLCELQFVGLPKTGLMVTPPQLSDHIGVCCLIDIDMRACPGKCESGGCQYKPAHRSIKSFFLAKKPPPILTTAAAVEFVTATGSESSPREPEMKKIRHEEVIDDD